MTLRILNLPRRLGSFGTVVICYDRVKNEDGGTLRISGVFLFNSSDEFRLDFHRVSLLLPQHFFLP